MSHRVFISYSSIDKDLVLRIVAAFDNADVPYFLDEKKIGPGDNIDEKVGIGIADCTELLVVLSSASIKSQWVQYEVGQARALKKRVLPFLAHPSVEIPEYLHGLSHEDSVENLVQYFVSTQDLPDTGPAPRTPSPPLPSRTVSWDELADAAETLYARIKAADFEPDTVVGVGRGGAIVQGIVGARFRQRLVGGGRLRPIQGLDRIYLRGREDIVVVGLHGLDVQDRNVLLLNAETYSGRTLKKAKQAVERLGPLTVKTGALFAIKASGEETVYQPDFTGRQLSERDTKLHLPWRREQYSFEEAVDTNELAERMLVVMHGGVGVGKTSVANVLVSRLKCYPLYTDEFWFKLGTRGRDTNPAISQDHNELMRDLCWSIIGSGRDAVLDCTSRWQEFREKLFTDFVPRGVCLVNVRCMCPEPCARARISNRKRFGPHDLGDDPEYWRVLKDYQPFTEVEIMRGNVIDVDTDRLCCDTRNAREGDEKRVLRVRKAIEEGYLAKMRPM